MNGAHHSFEASAAVPLRDGDYHPFLLESLRRSTRRVWASIFLVDVRRAYDVERKVRAIVEELVLAKARGVEVRILVGDSATSGAIREIGRVARLYFRAHHLFARRHPARGERGMHDKYVLIDSDLSIVGTHNWTPSALSLIEVAQARVLVIMFFLRYEAGGRYPTQELLDALVAARTRGADVRVILDRDAEGSAIGSTVVNEAAFAYLEAAGVAVRWDSVERYTHTKLVVVDDAHVVLGSHNWTAGSFFGYDDSSLYLNTSALAQHYAQQFETLWEEYAP